MMSNDNFVRGDGNGGLEANVQKAMLKRWGPIIGAALLTISGFASQMGEEVWSALAGRSGDLERIDHLEYLLDQNREDDLRFRSDLQKDMREMRTEIHEIHNLLRKIGDQ